MRHKISPAEATAITKLVSTLQPGWDSKEFLSKLADVREQHDFPEFMAQLTQCALAGLMIDEALAPVVPHVCPEPQQSEEWLARVNVVNEDDITKSVPLRKKRDLGEDVVRPPSEDPNHWRNRYAHKIDEGKREREALLAQSRTEQLPARASVEQPATAAATPQQSVPDPAAIAPELTQPVPNGGAYTWDPSEYEDWHDR